jgi:acyl-CoA thioester hydrolase
MQVDTYSKIVTVKKEHIDQQNHVNNVVFLQWVQEIAGDHWKSKKLTAFDKEHYWVVIDHYIKYSGEAFVNDVLEIKTYVEQIGGVRSTRMVEFHKGQKIIVVAKTNWCLLNRITKRPARISSQIANLFAQT